MMELLFKLLKVANPAELYAKAGAFLLRLGIVALVLLAVFIKGCSYGEHRVTEKQYNADKKALIRADKERRDNTTDATKTEKAEQQKAARLNQIGGRVHETVGSSASCDISPDELSDFNDLAAAASR